MANTAQVSQYEEAPPRRGLSEKGGEESLEEVGKLALLPSSGKETFTVPEVVMLRGRSI